MDISGRIILLTGGTSGIGRELAKQLQAKGAAVTVTGRNLTALDDMRAAGFGVIEADLTTREGVAALVRELTARRAEVASLAALRFSPRRRQRRFSWRLPVVLARVGQTPVSLAQAAAAVEQQRLATLAAAARPTVGSQVRRPRRLPDVARVRWRQTRRR